jgi:hypothetical protein
MEFWTDRNATSLATRRTPPSGLPAWQSTRRRRPRLKSKLSDEDRLLLDVIAI